MIWLTEEEKQSSVALIDVVPDLLSEREYRLNLTLAFQPVPLRYEFCGNTQECALGCTGAEIEVRVLRGTLTEHTGAIELKVEYQNRYEYSQTGAVTLKPDAKIKTPVGETSFSLGEVTYDAGVKREYQTSFLSSERTLAPVNTGNSVRWECAMPRGAKVTRDYLRGNVYLYATVRWPAETLPRGVVSVRPVDVRWFGPDKTALSDLKSLAMHIIAKRRNHSARAKNGYTSRFSLVEETR